MLLNEHGRFVASVSVDKGIQLLAKQKKCVPILDIRGFQCPSIPDEIALIKGLEEIYLDQNGLNGLPDSIGKVEHLKILSLGRNSITQLPATIVERWATLTTLFLGHNQITSLGFLEEDLWAFQHGSIGSNPLSEPIGRNWMIREDAQKIPSIMREMVPRNIQPHLAKLFAEQIIHILECASEPMVYELLYDNMRIEMDGTIIWNQHFDHPWLRYVAISLIPKIVRGTLIDSSFWPWNICNLSMKGIPEVPQSIRKLPRLVLCDIK
jgi:Leucine-rich repeat (LRR) protein